MNNNNNGIDKKCPASCYQGGTEMGCNPITGICFTASEKGVVGKKGVVGVIFRRSNGFLQHHLITLALQKKIRIEKYVTHKKKKYFLRSATKYISI